MRIRRLIFVLLEMFTALLATLAGGWLVRYAHGQVYNDRTKAAQNTVWLQKQADSQRISLAAGILYIDKRVYLPEKIGTRIVTKGVGTGYWYPPDHPSGLSLKQMRIVQITPGEPVFVLKGAGVISFSPLWLEGQGNAAAIEVEGKIGPVATGCHKFANIGFYNWKAAFRALGGYYKADGTFVADENHGDNCEVNRGVFCRCEKIFWSQNQQAINWTFNNSRVDWLGAPKPCIVADIERGGKVHFNDIEFCHKWITLFRVRDFSPNQCYLTARDLSYDRMLAADYYLRLFEYAGPANAANYSRWGLIVEGIAAQPTPESMLYKVPTDLPRDKWKVDLFNLYN